MSVKEDMIDTIVLRVETPTVRTKMFKNLDAALDYCRFAEPEDMNIRRVYTGGKGGVVEVVGYELNYVGSKGER